MLQFLFGEELYLVPLVRWEAEVVFCIVLLEISDVEEHYCCIMQLSCNPTRTEGKLSSWQEDPFEFVTFSSYMLLPSAKWSFQALGKNALVQRKVRVGLQQQFSSLPWVIVCIWAWPLSFCIPDATQAHAKTVFAWTCKLRWVLNGGVLPTSLSFWWRSWIATVSILPEFSKAK